MKAGLAVAVYDDFTDRPADLAGIRVWSPEGVRILKKEGGYFVCINPPESEYRICVESPWFYSQSLEVNPREEREACPIKKLRLIPGPDYPIPGGCFLAEGYGRPDTEVFFVCETQAKPLKLISDYKHSEGRLIGVYQEEETDLSGRGFYIREEGEKSGERFVFGEKMEGKKGFYRLKTPLSQNYKKVGTNLYPAAKGRTDRSGYYRVLLKGREGLVRGWQTGKDGTEISITGQISEERMIRMDFMETGG